MTDFPLQAFLQWIPAAIVRLRGAGVKLAVSRPEGLSTVVMGGVTMLAWSECARPAGRSSIRSRPTSGTVATLVGTPDIGGARRGFRRRFGPDECSAGDLG